MSFSRKIGYSLFFLLIFVQLYADQLTTSKAEGDSIHITQIIHSVYNPTGPSTSKNCGPASLAMCLRVLGYFNNFYMKYGDTGQLTPEEQVDHGRYLLYPGYKTSSVIRKGITYNLVTNRDSTNTDIESNRGNVENEIGAESYTVSNQEDLDKMLDNGMPVILFGTLDSDWRAQFSPYGHWNGSDGHYIAVTGKTSGGQYIVNDPLYYNGAETMSFNQLVHFSASNNMIQGTAFLYRVPKPFVIQKSNGMVWVFMRNPGDKYVYMTSQSTPNGSFGNWTRVNNYKTICNPVAIEQADGRLLLFVVAENRRILMFKENYYGSITELTDFGGETYYSPAVTKNIDGRVEFFARGIDGKVYKQYQTTANGLFSDWESLEGSLRSGPSATRLINDALVVFGGEAGASTQLTRINQTIAGGGWQNSWTGSGGHIKAETTAFNSGADNYAYAYVRSPSEDCIYYKTQQDGWYEWFIAGGSKLKVSGQPAAGDYLHWDTFSGGNITDQAIFIRGADNVVNWSFLKRRYGAYTWSDWSDEIGGIATSDTGAGNFSDGRLFVAVRGTTGYLYYKIQQGNSWSDWQILGNTFVFF